MSSHDLGVFKLNDIVDSFLGDPFTCFLLILFSCYGTKGCFQSDNSIKIVKETLIELIKNLYTGKTDDIKRPIPRILYLNRLVSAKRLASGKPLKV